MTPTDPAPPEPAIQVAARLLAQGQPGRAAESLAALVASAPTYAAAHVLRATALEAAGSVDAAIVSWGRAAALVPRSPLVHRERERLLATRLSDEPPPDLPPAEPYPARQLPPADAPVDALVDEAPSAEPSDTAPSDTAPADATPADENEQPEGAAGVLDEDSRHRADAIRPDPVGASQGAAPEAGPPPAHASPSDWASVASPQAPILAPEAGRPAAESDTSPSTPADLDTAGLDAAVDPDERGWGVLDEQTVPTPPPDAMAEPDVIAPERAPAPPAPTVADELDALITQLEDAPRIRPDPEYRGPEVTLDAGDVDDMASETLAKIYAAQHQYAEAALVYEKLAARRPDQADEMLERAAALRQRRS